LASALDDLQRAPSSMTGLRGPCGRGSPASCCQRDELGGLDLFAASAAASHVAHARMSDATVTALDVFISTSGIPT
jgi:hypothetical protein